MFFDNLHTAPVHLSERWMRQEQQKENNKNSFRFANVSFLFQHFLRPINQIPLLVIWKPLLSAKDALPLPSVILPSIGQELPWTGSGRDHDSGKDHLTQQQNSWLQPLLSKAIPQLWSPFNIITLISYIFIFGRINTNDFLILLFLISKQELPFHVFTHFPVFQMASPKLLYARLPNRISLQNSSFLYAQMTTQCKIYINTLFLKY